MLARVNQAVLLTEQAPPIISRKWLRWGLASIVGIALVYWLTHTVMNSLASPIQKIRVQGSFVQVNETMLKQAVVGLYNSSYFNVNIAQVQKIVEQLPWVETAAVRRVWPDTLAIHVKEQQALAQWHAGGLVNLKHDLFMPAKASYPEGLPVFKGPLGMHATIATQYQDIQAMLTPLNLKIAEIEIDARRATTVTLQGGIKLNLGRQYMFARLKRFVDVYPRLTTQMSQAIDKIDLRYSNGMAVTWEQN